MILWIIPEGTYVEPAPDWKANSTDDEPPDLLVKLDSIAQLSGDLWQLSPSVFVLATAIGETPVAPPGALFRCLVCDHNELEQAENSLYCPNCGRHWNYENGIYDFRLN